MWDRLVDEAQAARALKQLQDQGVQRGAIVAWLGMNSWQTLAALVACQRLGAVMLPLNWRLAAAELAQIVGQAGAGHLLASMEMEPLAAAIRSRVTLQQGPAPEVQDGDVLLVYTSGTTGQPKGAMHTRAGLQANAAAAIDAQGFDAASRVLSTLPLFHVGGLCIQTLPALAAGGQVRLHPRFDADAWFDDVAAWRPTTTLLVPATMRTLIEHPRWARADLSSLAFVNCGSQIVPRHLIDAFQARSVPVAQVYGATETGPVSIVLRPEEAMAHPGMAGRAALGVQLELAADGEILLRAPQMMRGYHRSADSGFDAQGWFHSGDLAVRHANGMIEVVGRSKEIIISGGENIHPAEIENLVAERPEVAECAVAGVPDPRWGEMPVLAVVARPGQIVDGQAILDALSSRLARFKQPRRVVVLAELPKTALGKVRRGDLAALLAISPVTSV